MYFAISPVQDVQQACLSSEVLVSWFVRDVQENLRNSPRKILRYPLLATEERETAGLIGSDKVEGTNVYDTRDENIGAIERLMIEKRITLRASVISVSGRGSGNLVPTTYARMPLYRQLWNIDSAHPLVPAEVP